MSKREASTLAPQGIDIDAPRAKRHKPGSSSIAASPPRKGKDAQQQHGQDVPMADDEIKAEENINDEEREAAKEKGLKLWQVVKDAVNKEGRILSNDFLRLPSKRQYPDYYKLIKAPVSLDEIKTRLEKKDYTTFDDVKQDLERCFKNAKRYNMKDSQIWKDAKYLHKLVSKEAAVLLGTEAPAGDGDDGEDHPAPGASSDIEEGGEKKKKPPNMNKLLKNRLEKLVKLTAPGSDRRRATEFMELPNKKKWPIYYKTIKKPQCLENIFKKLKRKEYHAPIDFANDVELVFSNALEFNQEHSEVWEDAIALRDHFRHLMSDLPPPFTIAAYATSDHSTKIKLKKPKPEGSSTAIPVANTNTPGTLLLRVPGHHPPATQSSSTTPAAPTKSPKVSKAVASPKPRPVSVLPATPTPAAAGSLQPASFAKPGYNASTSYYPNANYQTNQASSGTSLPNTNTIHPYMKPAQAQATPAASKTLHLQTHITPATLTTPNHAPAPIPTPTYRPPIAPLSIAAAKVNSLRTPTPTTPIDTRQLRSATLRIQPSGRRIDLDHKTGVRFWALRLLHADTSVLVSDVKFLTEEEEEEEESDDDAEVRPQEEEEEEEENGEQPEKSPRRSRGKPKKGGKTKGKDVKGKGKAVEATKKEHEELQVKLNGSAVEGTSTSGKKGLGWKVELGIGSNLIEIGEKDGVGWKVYLERPAAS